MSPKDLIAEAWRITRSSRKLLGWGIADASVDILYSIYFVFYQFTVLSALLQHGETIGLPTFLGNMLDFLQPKWLQVTVIVLIVIYLFLKLLIPTMALGAMIGLAAKIYKGEEPKGGLPLAFFNFVPLLELRAVFLVLSPFMFMTAASLIMRYLGGVPSFLSFLPFMLLIWLLFGVLHFFFGFSEEAVVIRKKGPFKAIAQSFKLIVSYLTHVIIIALLLIVLTLRIFLNAFVVLLVPSLIAGIGLALSTFLSVFVSYTISTAVGLFVLGFSIYFLGYVHVLKNTVWTLAYIDLSKRKELDIIEEPEQDVQVIKVQKEDEKNEPSAAPEEATEGEEDSGNNEFPEPR